MVGLILMGLEYLSGQRKSIPYLDSYGGLIFNETDPKQMENILNHKNLSITKSSTGCPYLTLSAILLFFSGVFSALSVVAKS